MHFGKGPILQQEFRDGETLLEGTGGVTTGVQSSTDSIIYNIELPPEAIITLKNGQKVISQKWLAVQPPPKEFFDAGGEVYDGKVFVYKSEMKDTNKMQCWVKDGMWYWNEKGGKWLAEKHYQSQLGRIAKYNETKSIYDDNNILLDMILTSKFGWFDASFNARRAVDGTKVRTASKGDDDNSMLILSISNLSSSVHASCLHDENGTVPLIVLDKISK